MALMLAQFVTVFVHGSPLRIALLMPDKLLALITLTIQKRQTPTRQQHL
jgi:hypothetical protein